MIKKLKYLIASVVLCLGLIGLSTAPVFAACPASGSPKDQVLQGVGDTGGKCDESGVTKFIGGVVKILSYVVGIAAIIMIVWSGFRYITSGGDSNKVAQAKNTLIYALVGIVVAVLAQAFVDFAISTASDAQKPTNNSNSSKTNNP